MTPLPRLFKSRDYLTYWKPFNDEERTLKEIDFIEKELRLKPGAKVLDLCCGYGRHSIALSERGYKVTGIDGSPLLIGEAEKAARKKGVSVEFINQDARKLDFRCSFDGCFNWFTSFGFSSDKENEVMVKRAYKALVPGGRFVLDMFNREHAIRHFSGSTCRELQDGSLLIQLHTIDFVYSRMNTKWICIKGNRRKEYKTSTRMYTAHEFYSMLKSIGFKDIKIYGKLGAKYSIEEWRMVVSAAR
jgi:ubiquinone/menaquinone biosynthesis C-methylase UbiE